MTHVLILGAAGMIGARLAMRIAENGTIGGQPVDRLTLADVVEPEAPAIAAAPAALPIETFAADISDPETAERLVCLKPDIIVHLAAIVSGEAEEDFDKGYRVNLEGTLRLLEALRAARHVPRLVFASSIAVYGAPYPERITDEHHLTPLTSYGTQKAICELLIADYSRKGYVDAVGLRLPTIVVRPGKPNKAASGFFSSIIREPLNGEVATLPVPTTVRHWMASPRAAVSFLERAATMDTQPLEGRRNLTMPGISVTVQEQIDTLRELAGQQRVKLIRYQPDERITAIVAGWPRDFNTFRARSLGFAPDRSFTDIVRTYATEEGIRL
ncbi:nucleoside-diphosphate-sugar epimerase [Breoghania corrubedonensis]|uniref:Nucleoside-diphosphate-sugar epimerase n=1 Tax=Breoghania corrubedonensis TaxID=665038 RepID=A0A2T5V6P8_9HYPH|nr:D-erythronate dehydrogenase [Breoghania corrubedonensis]PTW59431.1 nucleoside-diphosphate-sugar epimerase [Breoghania corrubedonensis]